MPLCQPEGRSEGVRQGQGPITAPLSERLIGDKVRIKAKGESEQGGLEGVTKRSLEVIGGALSQRRIEGVAERNLEAGEVEP